MIQDGLDDHCGRAGGGGSQSSLVLPHPPPIQTHLWSREGTNKLAAASPWEGDRWRGGRVAANRDRRELPCSVCWWKPPQFMPAVPWTQTRRDRDGRGSPSSPLCVFLDCVAALRDGSRVEGTHGALPSHSPRGGPAPANPATSPAPPLQVPESTG